MFSNESVNLDASISICKGTTYSNHVWWSERDTNVIWKSNNPSVASVSSKGVVTGKNPGTKSHSLKYYYNTLTKALKRKDVHYWDASNWKEYDRFDYDYYLRKYNVYDKVKKGKIDY